MKKICSIILAVISYHLSFSQQWNRIYPCIQGVSCNSIYFIDGKTGFIGGDSNSTGFIYKTTNAGRTWNKLNYNDKSSINSVYAVKDLHGSVTTYAVNSSGEILKNDEWGEFLKVKNVDSYLCNSVFFLNSKIGFAIGNLTRLDSLSIPGLLIFDNFNLDKGFIIKTIDGGKSWTAQVFDSCKFNTLFFTDTLTGFVVGEYGKIYRTKDGGINWLQVKTTLDVSLNSAFFVNATIGYLAGYDHNFKDYLFKTTDAGESWIILNPGTHIGILNLCFLNKNTGYISGYDGGIYKTTDGGITWKHQISGTTKSINSLCFTDSLNGYAGGIDAFGQGCLLKTTDGGISWKPTNSWLTFKPNSVFINRFSKEYTDIMYAVCDSGVILKSYAGGYNWYKKNSGTFNKLNSVFFTESETSYIAGNQGLLLKTSDHGEHWQSLNTGTLTNLKSIFFVDLDTGFLAGESGLILKTTDAGSTWLPLKTGCSENLNAVYFTDNITGYAVGNSGIILKTTNSGKSWTKQSSGTLFHLNSICFIKDSFGSNIGYIVGDNGTVLKTTNGGLTWIKQQSGTLQKLNSLAFNNSLNDSCIGYIIGEGGTILKTSDAGKSWFKIKSGSKNSLTSINNTINNELFIFGDSFFMISESFYRVQFSQEYTVIYSIAFIHDSARKNIDYAAGSGIFYLRDEPDSFFDIKEGRRVKIIGQILKTTDGGETWSELSFPDTIFLIRSVFITNESTLYVAGWLGTLFKSVNGGISWTKLNSKTNADLNSVYFTDSNTGYVVGGSNYDACFPQWENESKIIPNIILKTDDGGKSWKTQSTTSKAEFKSVFFIKNSTLTNTGYIAGSNGTILKTTDGGNHWEEQNTGISEDLNAVFFIEDNNGSNTGYAVGNTGTIIKTTDGGRNWISQISGTKKILESVYFVSKDTGYVVGESEEKPSGIILKTTDGGKTWINQPSSNINGFFSVFFSDPHTGFVGGNNGIILTIKE